MIARPQECRQLPLMTAVLKVPQLLFNIRVLTELDSFLSIVQAACVDLREVYCSKHRQINKMVADLHSQMFTFCSA